MPFVLAELLKGTGARKAPTLTVEGVNSDSRQIGAGDVFFAIPGTKAHGDSFAGQARQRGAVAIITDRKPAQDPGIPVVVVKDVRKAYANAASRVFPAQPEIPVAVTGTNGKSSIVSYVRQIWAYCVI